MINRKEFALILFTALTTTGFAAMMQSNPKPPPMNSIAIDWPAAPERANANGSSRKFFEGPSPTLDLLECHATTLKPGAMNHEILERPHDEVIIIKEGTAEAYVKDKWVKLGPGGVLFNAANAPQAMRNSSDAPVTYHVVMVRPPAPVSR